MEKLNEKVTNLKTQPCFLQYGDAWFSQMSNVQKKEVHVLQYPSEAAVALLSKLDVILN